MNYRKEIDGLRALAVLPVVLYHAGIESFAGGFVGVDIFFVISGFLITGIIYKDLIRQEFSFSKFYQRRARRILPALITVILFTIPFCWLWMPPEQLKDFFQSLIAVPLFASNMLFYIESDYFAPAAELKPLLHTWSLSIEEQFYIFFPIILCVALRVLKSWNKTILLLAITLLASLIAAQYMIYRNPEMVFYLLPYRAWELLIGSMAFFLYTDELFKLRLTSLIKKFLAYLGLFLIIFSLWFFDNLTPHPSIYTLLPTIGTLLILVYCDSDSGVGRLLSTPFLVSIGLVSYSLYLWHFPIFSIARIRTFGDLAFLTVFLSSLLSITAAFLTWRYIEKPFQNSNGGVFFSGRKLAGLCVAFGLMFVVIGIFGHYGEGFPTRLDAHESKQVRDLRLSTKPHSYNLKCKDGSEAYKAENLCLVFGDENSDFRIAVYGDSHATAILPVMGLISETFSAGIYFSRTPCPPLLGTFIFPHENPAICNDRTQTQFDLAKLNEIDVVIMVSRWSLRTFHNGRYSPRYLSLINDPEGLSIQRSRASFDSAMRKTVDKYNKSGVQIIFIDQVPEFSHSASQMINQMGFTGIESKDEILKIIKKTSVRITDVDVRRYSREAIGKHVSDGVVQINFDDLFLSDDRYVWSNGKVSFYRDKDHLTTAGAMRLAPRLTQAIQKFYAVQKVSD